MADLSTLFPGKELEKLSVLPPAVFGNQLMEVNYFYVIHFHVGISLEAIFDEDWTKDIIDIQPDDMHYITDHQERDISSAMTGLELIIRNNKAYRNYFFGQYALEALLYQSIRRLYINSSYNYYNIHEALLQFKEVLENLNAKDKAIVQQYHNRWEQH